MRLLLVEDDPELGPTLKDRLDKAGFAVDLADNGKEGEILGKIEPYDVVVLDLGLPQKSGLEVLQSWRTNQVHTPVVILTARDAWHEKVDGFKAGADDYVGKPFHVEELLARINAVLKRSHKHSGVLLQSNGIVLDEETQDVTLNNGEKLQLTGTEFRLLRYMMLNPNKVLSKSRLTEHVYEMDADKDSNVIEVYVKRLRNKLGKEFISICRGQG
ncbi:MAG: response regulator transcription factor, partial [Gammaproteobacteria bacterium]|nr:response regulator transcription factor [Gammaproteobacteria bacterium]